MPDQINGGGPSSLANAAANLEHDIAAYSAVAQSHPLPDPAGIQALDKLAGVLVQLASIGLEPVGNLTRAIDLWGQLEAVCSAEGAHGARVRTQRAFALETLAAHLDNDPALALRNLVHACNLYDSAERGTPKGTTEHGCLLIAKAENQQRLAEKGLDSASCLQSAVTMFQGAAEIFSSSTAEGFRARMGQATALMTSAFYTSDPAVSLRSAVAIAEELKTPLAPGTPAHGSVSMLQGSLLRVMADFSEEPLPNLRRALELYNEADRELTSDHALLALNRALVLQGLASRGEDPGKNFGHAIELLQRAEVDLSVDTPSGSNARAVHGVTLLALARANRSYGSDLDHAIDLFEEARVHLPAPSALGRYLLNAVAYCVRTLAKEMACEPGDRSSSLEPRRVMSIRRRLRSFEPWREAVVGIEATPEQDALLQEFARLDHLCLAQSHNDPDHPRGELWHHAERIRSYHSAPFQQRHLPPQVQVLATRIAREGRQLRHLTGVMSRFFRQPAPVIDGGYEGALEELRRRIHSDLAQQSAPELPEAAEFYECIQRFVRRASSGDAACWISLSYLAPNTILALIVRFEGSEPEVATRVFSGNIPYIIATFARDGQSFMPAPERATVKIVTDAAYEMLYRYLVGPLLEAAGDAAHIFVSADPPLAGLPLHAARAGDGTHATDRARFYYVPSASIVVQDATRHGVGKRRRRGPVRGTAFGADEPARSRGEIEWLESYYRGATLAFEKHENLADPQQIRAAIARARYVHIALHCSCHPDNILDSCFHFTPQVWLSAAEIAFDEEKAFQHVRLAFLNGCASAGAASSSATAMTSLAHALLLAGARGVIATLWPVMDDLAYRVATGFYHEWWPVGSRSPVVNAPEALHRALRRCREEDMDVDLWAPWVFLGDPSLGDPPTLNQ